MSVLADFHLPLSLVKGKLMEIPSDAERLAARGKAYTIEFAVKSPTRMAPAWEWALTEEDRNLVPVMSLLDRVAEHGNPHDEFKFKRLERDVWEFKFKKSGIRLLCVVLGTRILLTNALKKSGRSNIDGDIQAAERIAEGHLKWERDRSQQRNRKLSRD